MSDPRYMSLEDRMKIEAWLSEDKHPPEIARALEVHLSTVYRELKRGGYTAAGASYSATLAHEVFTENLRKRRHRAITNPQTRGRKAVS